jgi:hypothetical protein
MILHLTPIHGATANTLFKRGIDSTMFQPVCQHTQRQDLDSINRLLSSLAVGDNAWQF